MAELAIFTLSESATLETTSFRNRKLNEWQMVFPRTTVGTGSVHLTVITVIFNITEQEAVENKDYACVHNVQSRFIKP